MFCFFSNEFHGILVGNKPASVKAFRFTDLGHSPTFLPRQQRKNKTKRCCSVKIFCMQRLPQICMSDLIGFDWSDMSWTYFVHQHLSLFIFLWCAVIDCPHVCDIRWTIVVWSTIIWIVCKSYQLIDYSLLILSFKLTNIYIIILIRDMYHRGGCVGVNCRSWPNWSTICQRHPDIYEHSALH